MSRGRRRVNVEGQPGLADTVRCLPRFATEEEPRHRFPHCPVRGTYNVSDVLPVVSQLANG